MAKILAIATNASPQMPYGATGLWLSELTHYVDVLVAAGHQVDLASPKGGPIPLDDNSTTRRQLNDPANVRFLNDPRLKTSLEKSLAVGEVDPGAYDVLYLSGGHGTMWDFRDSEPLQRTITAMHTRGKLLTAVCHGVCGFIDSVDANGESIIRDRVVTGFSNLEDRIAGSLKHMPYLLEDELKNQGARYRKNLLPFTSRVDVDGNLITGQNPQSARSLAEAVARILPATKVVTRDGVLLERS